MKRRGKNYKKAVESATKQSLSIDAAVAQVKKLAYAKFDESVDVNVNVGIDSTKGDQTVRGSVVLPHGTGKKITVLVFAKGDYADQALKAGADYVGFEDLIEKINGNWLDFNYAIATPDVMGQVGQLAKILGPRGLLPNKKLGTVTFEVAAAVADLKKGRVFFRNDKSGIVHFSFGKLSFDSAALKNNLIFFLKALMGSKPAASKGKFLRKITISSTMGVGVSVNSDDIVRV
jgi:large subunit ribosomal protein L1